MEAVEVKHSYLIRSSIFRLDSKFFKKKYLQDEKLILTKNHQELSYFTKDIKSFGAYSLNNLIEYKESGVPFIRGINLKNGYINFNNIIYITPKSHKLLWKSEIKPKTILLSMSGTIGDVAFSHENYSYPMNSNQDIAKITIDGIKINAFYVYVFLMSTFGKNQVIREARGSVQQHIFLSQIEKIIIPVLSDNLQIRIEKLVNIFNEKLEVSKDLYRQAEIILLEKLGLLNYKSSKENIAIKPLSESFGASGRLDSEYYQPKYDELIEKVKLGNYESLKTLVSIKKSVEPGSDAYQDTGIPFVRVSNLTREGISEPDIHLLPSLFGDDQLKELQPKENTVLLSKDGTVGIAYTVKDETNIITSGAILHLTLKDNTVLPEYLSLVLNSIVVQMQSERDAGGSIIKHWKPSEIERIHIPVVDFNLQTQIEEKIKSSFKLKAESKQLLELAKQAVEVAIEKNEEEAIKLIKAYED